MSLAVLVSLSLMHPTTLKGTYIFFVTFQSLMFKGLYINIIHVMEQYDKHPGVQRGGCRALRGLSLSGCSDKELLINCGVLELVFSCTQRYHNIIVICSNYRYSEIN